MGSRPWRTMSVLLLASLVALAGCNNTPTRDKQVLGATTGNPPQGRAQTQQPAPFPGAPTQQPFAGGPAQQPFPQVPTQSNSTLTNQQKLNPFMPANNAQLPGASAPTHGLQPSGPIAPPSNQFLPQGSGNASERFAPNTITPPNDQGNFATQSVPVGGLPEPMMRPLAPPPQWPAGQ